MKVPLSWLRQYVDVDIPPSELAHRLTMAGVEVGEVVETGGWSEVYVGSVTSVRQHPNADRLRLCTVTTGPGPDGNAEEMEVVCGAPNVAEGQKICFARVGANLYNAHSGRYETLAAAQIRGVESQGMICSELELGLGDDHTGIIVLPDDAPLGEPLSDYLGDTVLDLELTPNRLDCLSMLGVAHEVAALTGGSVAEPEVRYEETGAPVDDRVSISIADPDLCHRYTATVIDGVSIGPSPQWLQDRLNSAGLRPISNVVDVTNFVMLEYNQPLHAFDLDTVNDKTVIVRRARQGETLTTLDGVERKLTSENLVIADSSDPIGLGGVIGGANSEIGPHTRTVLLESANFNAANNRETATSMGLRTEATLRFEKGLRLELAPLGLLRATALIQEVAGGTVAPGFIDVYPEPPDCPPTVSLTTRRLRQSLGMDVDLEQARKALESLGFSCVMSTQPAHPEPVAGRAAEGALEVTIPWWRNDVNIEDDLVEEVVRIIGYDAVPTVMLSTPIPYYTPTPAIALREEIKDLLASGGLQEVINYTLVSAELLERVAEPGEAMPSMQVANPMSSTHEVLRPTLQPGILATLASNQSTGSGPFRFFEVGRVFLPRSGDLPEEMETIAAVMAGQRAPDSWLAGSGGTASMDFFDAKGVVEWLLEGLDIQSDWEPGEHPVYQPGRCAVVRSGDAILGFVGEIHPNIRERFDIDSSTVAGFELYLQAMLHALPESERRFDPLPRFPAATRDLALVVPIDVPAGQVTSLILRNRLVQRAELFDIYSGENLAPGTKSLAFHVHLQAPDRTLTNEEVTRSLDGLLRSLEREVGASLRS